MMKGVMMTATISVPAGGASEQAVTSLVNAGKQAYTGPYTVTVRKIEPVVGSNQVRVTFFISGEDEPAHDFTETGNQVVAALLNGGMHANISGAGTAKVEQIEAVEGGDDDSDENSENDALSGLVHEDDPPQQRVRPPDAQ